MVDFDDRVLRLPWEWFDFLSPPTPFTPAIGWNGIPTVENGGAHQVLSLTVDGRSVPFKVFKQLPPSGATIARRPMLILSHGMGLSIASFRGIAHYLLESHDLAFVDYSSLTTTPLPGWPTPHLSMKTMANAIASVIDALDPPAYSLAGSSLGGGLSLLNAYERRSDPRLQSLLLSNPAAYPQRLPRTYRWARIPLLGEFFMSITAAPVLVAGVERVGYVDPTNFHSPLRDRYHRTMAARGNRYRLMDMIRHLPGSAQDFTLGYHKQFPLISCPTLVTWGEQDKLLAEGAGLRLANDLPKGVYKNLPGLSHLPHEEAPDIVGPLWSEFLRNPDAFGRN